MFKSLSLMFFSYVLLFAANPLPFSQLGDEIYNSLDSYKTISRVFPQMKSSINAYVKNATQTKQLGFKAEASSSVAKKYFVALRKLDNERQLILTQLNAMLYRAMDDKTLITFKTLINSHLIDLDKVGDDVIPFYKKNYKPGSIKILDRMVRNERRYKIDARKSNVEYAKRVEEQRIQRMREASIEADRSREAELDKEIEKEREEINAMMENELIR
jgi:hypothetical protein